MPDTGAPFNLPFPAPSDLVRNAPNQFEALADATADALGNIVEDTDNAIAAIPGPREGIGPKVVFASTSSTTSLGTDTPIGLSASITPTSASHRVLVIAAVGAFQVTSAGVIVTWRIFKGNTALSATTGRHRWSGTTLNNFDSSAGAMVFLDQPATAESVNYNVRATSSGTASITGLSTMILIEVAP